MAASIKAIDAASVHQITSGQVITDLQTAVKELVENSLDAGATNIDIKFKNYGSTSFEVVDNGSGVQPKDYRHIALKGYTSKLERYDGLTSVTSFGFRGEALSSLCQLADVTITTATEDESPIGTILTFDKRGQLLSSSSKTARPKGTTVHVVNLFSGMPVRKKEFDRNSKKHFAAAQTLLQAYGLISVGKRITLSNQQEGKTVQTLFKTEGRSLRENYATLFGAKSAAPLLDLDLELEVEAAKRVLKMAGLDELHTKVRVRGLVSSPNANAGRTSGDRQFLFVNGRPFEAKAITKAFNEVFRSYAPQHFPSVVADFELARDSYDVNVSPDKRSIFLHSEQNLIEALKIALDAFYSPSRATFSMDATNMTRAGRLTSATAPAADSRPTPAPARREHSSTTPVEETAYLDNAVDGPISNTSRKRGLEDVQLSEDDGPLDTQQANSAPDTPHEAAVPLFRRASTSQPLADEVEEEGSPAAVAAHKSAPVIQTRLSSGSNGWTLSAVATAPSAKRGRKEKTVTAEEQATLDRMKNFLARSSNRGRPPASRQPSASSSSTEGVRSEDIDLLEDQRSDSDANNEIVRDESQTSIAVSKAGDAVVGVMDEAGDGDEVIMLDKPEMVVTDWPRPSTDYETFSVPFDLADVRARLKARREKQQSIAKAPSFQRAADDLEEAGIKVQDDEARKALSRLVSKEDFAKMQIVGQFNLAFIIVRRREAVAPDGSDSTEPVQYHDDLMIIDQHASDEKFNFERLQLVTKIDSQRLIKPRVMELPASDELLAMENEHIFRFNGFDIEVDEEAPVGQRIKLVSMPISKSTKKIGFTVEDFEELLFLLRDRTGGGMIRPTKTRRLFAMLACRSSVMVGKVLNAGQMATIVKHMGTLDQPWNCPHGRNTMRWLTGLEARKQDDRFKMSGDRFQKYLQEAT